MINVAKQHFLFFFSFCLSKDEGLGSWGEENPATDLGPAEEGTDHLLGHTEKAVQTMQRKNERGEIRTVNEFTGHRKKTTFNGWAPFFSMSIP